MLEQALRTSRRSRTDRGIPGYWARHRSEAFEIVPNPLPCPKTRRRIDERRWSVVLGRTITNRTEWGGLLADPLRNGRPPIAGVALAGADGRPMLG